MIFLKVGIYRFFRVINLFITIGVYRRLNGDSTGDFSTTVAAADY